MALYLELLTIWTEQVKQKARGNTPDIRDRAGPGSARAVQMEMTSVVSLVDENEAHGFFFLCSQSRRVRSYAIRVLRLVIQFDNALGKEEPSRIIKILEIILLRNPRPSRRQFLVSPSEVDSRKTSTSQLVLTL